MSTIELEISEISDTGDKSVGVLSRKELIELLENALKDDNFDYRDSIENLVDSVDATESSESNLLPVVLDRISEYANIITGPQINSRNYISNLTNAVKFSRKRHIAEAADIADTVESIHSQHIAVKIPRGFDLRKTTPGDRYKFLGLYYPLWIKRRTRDTFSASIDELPYNIIARYGYDTQNFAFNVSHATTKCTQETPCTDINTEKLRIFNTNKSMRFMLRASLLGLFAKDTTKNAVKFAKFVATKTKLTTFFQRYTDFILDGKTDALLENTLRNADLYREYQMVKHYGLGASNVAPRLKTYEAMKQHNALMRKNRFKQQNEIAEKSILREIIAAKYGNKRLTLAEQKVAQQLLQEKLAFIKNMQKNKCSHIEFIQKIIAKSHGIRELPKIRETLREYFGDFRDESNFLKCVKCRLPGICPHVYFRFEYWSRFPKTPSTKRKLRDIILAKYAPFKSNGHEAFYCYICGQQLSRNRFGEQYDFAIDATSTRELNELSVAISSKVYALVNVALQPLPKQRENEVIAAVSAAIYDPLNDVVRMASISQTATIDEINEITDINVGIYALATFIYLAVKTDDIRLRGLDLALKNGGAGAGATRKKGTEIQHLIEQYVKHAVILLSKIYHKKITEHEILDAFKTIQSKTEIEPYDKKIDTVIHIVTDGIYQWIGRAIYIDDLIHSRPPTPAYKIDKILGIMPNNLREMDDIYLKVRLPKTAPDTLRLLLSYVQSKEFNSDAKKPSQKYLDYINDMRRNINEEREIASRSKWEIKRPFGRYAHQRIEKQTLPRLSLLYCPTGEMHEWDVFYYHEQGKKLVEYPIKTVNNRLTREPIDRKCTHCGQRFSEILSKKALEVVRENTKITGVMNKKFEDAAFDNYYLVRCPEGDVHIWVEDAHKKMCKKCGLTQEKSESKPNFTEKYREKYRETYEKTEFRAKDTELNLKTAKFTPPKIAKKGDFTGGATELSSRFDFNAVKISNIGVTFGVEITNLNRVITAYNPYIRVQRINNYINIANSVYNSVRFYDGIHAINEQYVFVGDITDLLKAVPVNGTPSRDMPDIWSEYYTQYSALRHTTLDADYAAFAIWIHDYFCRGLLNIVDKTDAKYKKVAELIVRRIIDVVFMLDVRHTAVNVYLLKRVSDVEETDENADVLDENVEELGDEEAEYEVDSRDREQISTETGDSKGEAEADAEDVYGETTVAALNTDGFDWDYSLDSAADAEIVTTEYA